MVFSRSLAFGTGAIIGMAGMAIGGFSANITVNSETVFPYHKGSHLRRMYEVAMAHFTQRNIKDDYTAQNHMATVMTLSLRSDSEDEFTKKNVSRDLNR